VDLRLVRSLLAVLFVGLAMGCNADQAPEVKYGSYDSKCDFYSGVRARTRGSARGLPWFGVAAVGVILYVLLSG
jgi:hypothetical protein